MGVGDQKRVRAFVVAPNKQVFYMQDWVYQPRRFMCVLRVGIHAAQVPVA